MSNNLKYTANDLKGNEQYSKWLEFTKLPQSGEVIPFDEQLRTYLKIYSNRKAGDSPPIVWTPGENEKLNSNIAGVMRQMGFENYAELHKWSVGNRKEFWKKTAEIIGYKFSKDFDDVIDISGGNINPVWFPGAELNCIDSCFTAEPDKIAIVSGNENSNSLKKMTYGDLELLTNRIANGILERGFKKGSRIAIYMPMTPQCVAAYLGIIKAGCQVVSIADSFSSAEIRKRMEIAESDVIITVDSYRRSGKTIDLFKKVKDAGVGTAIVIESESDKGNGAPKLREKDLLWSDFLSDNDSFASVQSDPYSYINILFSSGTTGTPKAIPWNHITPLKCASDGFYHQDIHKGDVIAWPTNIGWMMGPWLIFAALINEGTIALFEGSPAGAEFVNFVKNAGVNIMGVIPSLVKTWRNRGLVNQHDWENIRVFSSTGEPSNWEDYFWLMSRANFKAPVIEYMGGTEIGGGYLTGTVIQPASPSTFTTPALGTDFKLLKNKTEETREGEKGEVFLVPPSIGLSQELLNKNHFDVYYKNCPTDPDGNLLRRHGDQIRILKGGFYQAEGRTDDTMNIGGIKVSSIELEKVINSHKAVIESAAISFKKKGEAMENLVLFTVAKTDVSKDELFSELKILISKKLNPLFRIYDLIIIDKLPKTASNKLKRRELREIYIENMYIGNKY